MASKAVKAIVYIIAAVLVFFGLVFIISVNLGTIYLVIGLVFIGIAAGLLIAVRDRKPIEIKQTVNVTGPIKGTYVKCPNCGANVDPMTAKVIEGKPYVTCDHCGTRFELTEEPMW